MSNRTMALTPELVALCWRKEEKRGWDEHWTPLTDGEQDALAERLCREAGGQPIWVFAYGSLIWRPTFEAAEHRRATAIGWHRSFCMDLTDWRGTPEQPGLMMALDRGGRCGGVAYRLPQHALFGQVSALVRREILFREDLGMVRWIPLRTAAGDVRALVFWAGPTGEGISLKLPLEKVAWVLLRGISLQHSVPPRGTFHPRPQSLAAAAAGGRRDRANSCRGRRAGARLEQPARHRWPSH